ncbi:MAG: glycoside hydrolase family 28 protein [Polyangiaceae bacterium]
MPKNHVWVVLVALTACSPKPPASLPQSAAPASVAPTLEPIEPLRAPFAMPALERPRFPPHSVELPAFGGVAGGSQSNTEAFRRAIAELSRLGGGTLEVPAGVWLSGPIHLASNIHLHVQRGAEIRFSQRFADYLPAVFTRWEGIEVYNYSPLIYARDAENVAVTGEGVLNGQGEAWWPWKKTQQPFAARLYQFAEQGTAVEQRVLAEEGGLRPSFLQTISCKNVLVEGVTLRDGPMWTIHPVYSENVIVRRVRVETHGPNNDGCNPDSSRNVLIEDSFFSTGDDCIVLKSGLNEDGWRVAKPTENVVIRRIHGERGHGGVVIGSEMSGGVRNVYAHDSEFIGTDRGLRMKSMRGRGGVVERIYYENVRHSGIRLLPVEITTFYNASTLKPLTQTPPLIRDVFVRNLSSEGGQRALEIVGLPEQPIASVHFDNVTSSAEQGAHCVACQDVEFSNTHIAARIPPQFQIEKSSNIRVDRSCSNEGQCVSVDAESRVSVDGNSPSPM